MGGVLWSWIRWVWLRKFWRMSLSNLVIRVSRNKWICTTSKQVRMKVDFLYFIMITSKMAIRTSCRWWQLRSRFRNKRQSLQTSRVNMRISRLNWANYFGSNKILSKLFDANCCFIDIYKNKWRIYEYKYINEKKEDYLGEEQSISFSILSLGIWNHRLFVMYSI